ncbi:MAG: FkbM family methyltransferase [Pseudonocardiaceae bacterium]
MRCYYWRGVWVHSYPGGSFIVDRKPTFLDPSLCASIVRDVYLYEYTPRPGDIVLDVGAGIGLESVEIARLVGPSGRVVAVEANALTASCIEWSCALSGIDNVDVVVAAAGSGAGRMYVEDSAQHRENKIVANPGEAKCMEVQGIRLDDLPGTDRVDFMKMNIEGGEVEALEGMPRILACARHVAVFCHDFLPDTGTGARVATLNPVRKILEDAGFSILQREADTRPGVRHCLYGSRAESAY